MNPRTYVRARLRSAGADTRPGIDPSHAAVHAALEVLRHARSALVPVRRLVSEERLAARVTRETAVLDAESIELGSELLPEHGCLLRRNALLAPLRTHSVFGLPVFS